MTTHILSLYSTKTHWPGGAGWWGGAGTVNNGYNSCKGGSGGSGYFDPARVTEGYSFQQSIAHAGKGWSKEEVNSNIDWARAGSGYHSSYEISQSSGLVELVMVPDYLPCVGDVGHVGGYCASEPCRKGPPPRGAPHGGPAVAGSSASCS